MQLFYDSLFIRQNYNNIQFFNRLVLFLHMQQPLNNVQNTHECYQRFSLMLIMQEFSHIAERLHPV